MYNGNTHQHKEKRIQNLVSDLDTLFESIRKAFEVCPEIQQAAVLLGGTVITPKESYIFNLPNLCPEADNISLKSSKQALFRHLVGEQVLASDALLSPTTTTVLLNAPRLSALHGFIPKTAYKVPTRGRCLTLNMVCRQPSMVCHDLTYDDYEVEISGIEPLESSAVEVKIASEVKTASPDKMLIESFLVREESHTLHGQCNKSETTVRKERIQSIECDLLDKGQIIKPLVGSTPKVGYLCQSHPIAESFLSELQYDCIWFQCRTVIKGYREY